MDDNVSLAERCTRRLNRRLPERFQDNLLQPLTSLPPDVTQSHPSSTSDPPSASSSISPSPTNQNPVLKFFRSTCNFFGLSRQYYSESLPSHDPEENLELVDRSDALHPVDSPGDIPASSTELYYPYPNKTSLLLGEWYWNNGYQKSQQSFKDLLGIVGDPQFRPEDVQRTNWAKIDKVLAENKLDGGKEAEWMDDDAGWTTKPITIAVPFHGRAKSPGVHHFHVGDFHYRPLVSVIREKLSNKRDHSHFHYEPFELLWTPFPGSEDVRVHGELYNSPAFLDAHRELQESPKEPGCDLPRVILAMMFSSDATHLTSFGTAKLWPCYLFFGNESKYRRCKPTCHLCEHVAYFQSVTLLFTLCFFF